VQHTDHPRSRNNRSTCYRHDGSHSSQSSCARTPARVQPCTHGSRGCSSSRSHARAAPHIAVAGGVAGAAQATRNGRFRRRCLRLASHPHHLTVVEGRAHRRPIAWCRARGQLYELGARSALMHRLIAPRLFSRHIRGTRSRQATLNGRFDLDAYGLPGHPHHQAEPSAERSLRTWQYGLEAFPLVMNEESSGWVEVERAGGRSRGVGREGQTLRTRRPIRIHSRLARFHPRAYGVVSPMRPPPGDSK